MPFDLEDLYTLIDRSHEAAKAGGWWTDLETGEPLNRNRGEMLCLMHSEVSEGFEADLFGRLDDKLPTRVGAEVELADLVIRAGDYAGGFGYVVTINPVTNQEDARLLHINPWALIHLKIDEVMEAERKNRPNVEHLLSDMLSVVVAFCERRTFDLTGAMEEKMAFNAQRADHKPENRAKADGKQF